MASVRELRPGRWELRLYLGKDPLTGKPIAPHKPIDAPDKRTAQLEAAAWELAERKKKARRGQVDTMAGLFFEYLRLNKALWSPKTLKEHLGIIDRYFGLTLRITDTGDVEIVGDPRGLSRRRFPIDGHDLHEYFTLLAQRGGQCTHRPCPKGTCPGHPGGKCTRPWCKAKRGNKPCPGHPGPRCTRPTCPPPCAVHEGHCATWEPCETRPCDHSGPLAVGTLARIRNVVSAALADAVRWDWIAKNPAGAIKLPEDDPEQTVEPTVEEWVHLLALSEAEDWRLAVYELLSTTTGARRGAAHAVRRGDINLETGDYDFELVCVQGPDKKWVVVRSTIKKGTGRGRLDAYTLAAVRALVAQFDTDAAAAGVELGDDHFLFSDDLGRTCWIPASTSARVHRIREAAGLLHIKLRALRGLMVTHLLDHEISPKIAAEKGGWRKVDVMLNRYARASVDGHQAAADAMGELISLATVRGGSVSLEARRQRG